MSGWRRGMAVVLAVVGFLLLLASGGYLWAVQTQSVAALDWFDARFPRDVDAGSPSRLHYGESPQQVIDLYRPRDIERPPLIIFIPGGGWQNGDPGEYGFVARQFAQSGYATALVGYRLGPDGRFPVMLEDSAAAVGWLVTHADELGLQADRLVLAGQSAGAYNAVMLALDRRWLEREGLPDDAVKGVVGLSGPYDFYPFDTDSTKKAFGQVANPLQTQPIGFARADAPPMLLVTGEEDTTVKPRNSRALAARLAGLGADVRLVVIPGLGHADTVTLLARPFDRDRRLLSVAMPFVDEIARSDASAAVQPAKR